MDQKPLNTPLVSVIVPVYNAEPFLDRCINSILNQTYPNIEVWLIDDGSQDNSREICEKFTQDEIKINFIPQENAGVGAARNSGLKVAKGQFIAFVDSDDWIHTRYIEILTSTMIEHNADLAECDKLYTHEVVDEHIIENVRPTIFNKQDAIARSLTYGIWGVPYRMFSRNAIGDIEFKEGVIAEDAYFTFEVLSRIKKMGVVDEKLYFYFHNSQSYTKKEFKPKKMYDYVKGSEAIKTIVSKESNPNLDKLAARNLGLVCIRLIKELAEQPNKDKDYKHRKWLRNIILDNMWGDPLRFQFLLIKYLPLPLFCNIVESFRKLKQ